MEEAKLKVEQNNPNQKRSFFDNVWSGAKNAIVPTKGSNDKRSASSRYLDSTLRLSIIGIVLFAMIMSVVTLGPFGWILAAAIGGAAIGKYIYDKKQNEQKMTNIAEQKKAESNEENIKSEVPVVLEETKKNEISNEENTNQNDKNQDINNNITSNQSQFFSQYNQPFNQQYNSQFPQQYNPYTQQHYNYNAPNQQYNQSFQPLNQQNKFNNQNLYQNPQQFQQQNPQQFNQQNQYNNQNLYQNPQQFQQQY